jgi:hypothetical protein
LDSIWEITVIKPETKEHVKEMITSFLLFLLFLIAADVMAHFGNRPAEWYLAGFALAYALKIVPPPTKDDDDV